MSFLGKEYTFVKQENFEDFVRTLGIPEQHAQYFLNTHPNQKLVQEGSKYKMITSLPDGDKEVVFQSGVPFKETILERNCETTCVMDGNTLKQVQKFEDGAEVHFTKKYSDSELIVDIQSSKSGTTARRFYKAL